ncbi:hypothetical protein [Sphingobacterium detergens]|nr:hypothetical protein [Sphingobacterium detergens]
MSILIGVFTLASCKIYENKKRDKREEFEMDWQHSEQRQRLYTFRQDTLSRLWYFWTDSAFRFHADSGLFAKAGNLIAQESGRSRSKHMQDLAEKNEHGKQKDNKQERSINKMLSATYFWFVGFALVLLLLWRWTRSRLLV